MPTGGSDTWPNNGPPLIAVAVVAAVISTIFGLWRLIVRFKISPLMGITDYLMILCLLVNFTATAPLTIVQVVLGDGRKLEDPFWTHKKLVRCQHISFAGQVMNVYAMFLCKASICVYLMPLNFSKSFRYLIWATLATVTVCGFIMPAIGHWALCQPVAMRWDSTVKGHCLPQELRITILHIQVVSNIVTDIVFAVFPLVYLRRVQLNKSTKWGVRIVFMLALIGTAVSIGKFVAFQKFQTTKEPLYDISLSLWSICEVNVAIVIANVPPLRKSLDGFIRMILPAHLLSSMGLTKKTGQGNSYAMQSMYGKKSRPGQTGDDESETAILPGLPPPAADNGKIMRTTQVTVTGESASMKLSSKASSRDLDDRKGFQAG